MGSHKKRKNRTHLKGPSNTEEDSKSPKSFVIKSGHVGLSVAQLVRDIRKVMEPGTASRLRERSKARLRDYLTMAPILNVTHLLILTLSEQTSSLHLRLARLPAGPTLTFRIERYSLMKDLLNTRTRNVGQAPGGEYRTPPLLVLSNFQPAAGARPEPQLKLMSTMFQGMFPPIQVDKAALPSFRRVLLISYHTATKTISFRHYTITVKASGISRRVKRVLESTSGAAASSSRSRRPLDLGNDLDIADYLLRIKGQTRDGTPSTEGYETGSETEGSASENESDGGNRVELPSDYVGRGNKKGANRAVKLVEIGPRIEMKLVKVVEGIVGSLRGEGETVFHERVSKTAAERSDLKKTHAERSKLKADRRKEQEANVARKKAEKEAKAPKKKQFAKDDDEMDDEDEDEIVEDGGEEVDDEEDEFAYEDAAGGDQDSDEDLDAEDDAGDVSDVEDESSDEEEEVAKPSFPRKKSKLSQ